MLVAGENSGNGLVVITSLPVTPSITGTVANQPATDQISDMPFFGVTICDASTNSPAETVTITPSATANGALVDTNSAADGSTISTMGVYTVKGSAAAVTTDIEQRLFIPMPHEVALGQTVQTGFTTSDTSSNGYSASDSTSSVIVTVVASAITATPATETVPTTDEKTASPFSNVAINDLNYGQTEMAVVSVGTPATGTLSDPNAATDGSTTSNGAVTITGSATAVATALDGLVFTPTAHQAAPGSVVATTITAAISDTAGQKTLIASTVDATESSSHNVINGPAGGRAKIYGISGNDQITAFSTNNTIYGEGGNNLINAGAGNAIVTLGSSRNAVSGGTGNTSLTGGPSGYNSVALGNGNDTATVGGTHDVIVLGGSGNTVSAGSGSNTISGGTGSNTFILPGAGQGFDAISGFTETNGNVLNLHAALQETNWNGKANTLGNYVKATDVGNNTDISIANTGMGSGVLVAQLTNTPKLGFADLISHNSISTGADAPNALERQHSPSRVGTEEIMYIGTHPSDLRLMRQSAQRMQGSSSRLRPTLSGSSDRLRPPWRLHSAGLRVRIPEPRQAARSARDVEAWPSKVVCIH